MEQHAENKFQRDKNSVGGLMKEAKFSEFVHWAFQALVLALGTWGVSELSSLNKSIQELNVKVAVIIEKNENHERRLEKLEEK